MYLTGHKKNHLLKYIINWLNCSKRSVPYPGSVLCNQANEVSSLNKKRLRIYRSPLSFSSLRWHYPDQVIGVYSQVLFLCLFSLFQDINFVLQNHPLEKHLQYYIKTHASNNQQVRYNYTYHIEEIVQHENPR